MAEMLIQNHEGYVEFLPCLPAAWKNGQFKGLCIRGGAEVSAQWEDAVIQHASLKATADNTFTVKLPTEKKYTVTLNGKEVSAKTDSKGLITVEMKVQDLLEIK